MTRNSWRSHEIRFWSLEFMAMCHGILGSRVRCRYPYFLPYLLIATVITPVFGIVRSPRENRRLTSRRGANVGNPGDPARPADGPSEQHAPRATPRSPPHTCP